MQSHIDYSMRLRCMEINNLSLKSEALEKADFSLVRDFGLMHAYCLSSLAAPRTFSLARGHISTAGRKH